MMMEQQQQQFIVKHFVHHVIVEQLGMPSTLTVSYDVQIPLPDPTNCAAPSDLFGHLLAQNHRLPRPFRKDVRAKFEQFVRDETRKFDAELATRRIELALLNSGDSNGGGSDWFWNTTTAGTSNNNDEIGGEASQRHDRTILSDAHATGVTKATAGEQPPFEEQFQHVMRHASVPKLSLLVREEIRMTEEMRALVRARNFEVARIKLACEHTLAQSSVAGVTDDFEKRSYEISMLNEKLRQVTINYSNQIEALNEQQRHAYRQLVRALYANGVAQTDGEEYGECNSDGEPTAQKQLLLCSDGLLGEQFTNTKLFRHFVHRGGGDRHASIVITSFSCDSKMAQLGGGSVDSNTSAAADIGGAIIRRRHRSPVVTNQQIQCRSESFTIYIGAQLKTMHNARILTCDSLVDLMTTTMNNTNKDGTAAMGGIASKSVIANGTAGDGSGAIGIGTAAVATTAVQQELMCHSQRLQLLMNLYRRDLACTVLIVGGSDPLWHVKERTKFAQLCEQSAELHFESLERQLMKIEQDVRTANRDRRAAAAARRQRQQQHSGGGDDVHDNDEGTAEQAVVEPSSSGCLAEATATTASSPSSGTTGTASSVPNTALLLLAEHNDDDGIAGGEHVAEQQHISATTTTAAAAAGAFIANQQQQKGREEDNYGDVNSLRPGDVYVTCHSNLSAVQVVFHVVGDRLLLEQDISSRHASIGALRNVIRLTPFSGIHHITLPLLLVEHMSETMTMGWCLGRAELVFKCLKGFLMEVCSSGVSIAIAGGGGAVTTAGASGNAAGTPHFNINFVLPAAISPALFQQLVELFSSIFHHL